jgi:hypothetical protein
MLDPVTSVEGAYIQKEITVPTGTVTKAMIDNYIKTEDITGAEGRPADGAVRLLMGSKREMELKQNLESLKSAGAQYNPRDNNCTTYVSEALNAVGVSIQPEEITAYMAGIFGGYPVKNKSFTPNTLFKQLKSQKLFTPTIIVDPGKKVSQSYSEAVVDDNVKERISK